MLFKDVWERDVNLRVYDSWPKGDQLIELIHNDQISFVDH